MARGRQTRFVENSGTVNRFDRVHYINVYRVILYNVQSPSLLRLNYLNFGLF